MERLYHRVAGGFLCATENLKRLAFEFLPLPWLRNYRLYKDWFFGGKDRAERRSFRQQLSEHWPTIIVSLGLLLGVGIVDYFTGPVISLAAFYALPAMMLTLIVSRGWGSFVALLAAAAWSAFQLDSQHWDLVSEAVMVWNTFMRFVVLQVIVLLLDRIRLELVARNNAANTPPTEEVPRT